MGKSTQLSFIDLQKDVIDKGFCSSGGACVDFCKSEQIGAIDMCGCAENLPVLLDPKKCLNCGICYLICPKTEEVNNRIKEEFGWSFPLGQYQDIFSARAKNKKIREIACDGGIVTALLTFMLDNNLIDAAVVARRTGLLSFKPEMVTNKDILFDITKSKFSGFYDLESPSDKFTNYVSVLPPVRMFGAKPALKIAVVGAPCQITAIRKTQVLDILPENTIFFTIGLFCMYSYSFLNLSDKNFIKKYKIDPDLVKKINIKEDFIVTLRNGETINVDFNDVEDIVRPSCSECEDFINNYADISVGGIGSPDGYTTTMIRSDLGKEIFKDAIKHNYIEHPYTNKKQKKEILEKLEQTITAKINRAQKNKALHRSNLCEKLNEHLRWVLSFVSHELSNTLGTSIINISALVDDEISANLNEEAQNKMLNIALSNLKLMQDMITNYLMTSKAKNGHLIFLPTSLKIKSEIVDQVIKRLEPALAKSNLSIQWIEASDVSLNCDRALIRIVINNLINNAIKYGTKGSCIYISINHWEDGFKFIISNEGVGIPDNKMEEIFEEYTRFNQTGVRGTGLGLHLVQIIAAIHDGKITADSGYIINNERVTYKMVNNNPEKYKIDPDDKNLKKFATFTLCIPNSKARENKLKN